jgi:hypothetical protein
MNIRKMKKIIIDPSIAVDLDIDRVSLNERVFIRFIADANWTGIFELVIYNSSAKNSLIKPLDALIVLEEVMTWVIEPSKQGINAGVHFYEIVETHSKRIIFRGKLNITK